MRAPERTSTRGRGGAGSRKAASHSLQRRAAIGLSAPHSLQRRTNSVALAILCPPFKRPCAWRVGRAVAICISRMVEDQCLCLAWRRTERTPDLLQIERQRLGRPQQNGRHHAGHIEPFGNQAAIAQDLQLTESQRCNQRAAFVLIGVTIDMGRAITGLGESCRRPAWNARCRRRTRSSARPGKAGYIPRPHYR